MRCIETTEAVHTDRLPKKINYNMRCIETWYIKVSDIIRVPDKLQHEMYWNDNVVDFDMTYITINYNMRCIETLMSFDEVDKLTEDKLQHEMYWNNATLFQNLKCLTINYNMRCIETRNCCYPTTSIYMINYNMRCIETYV